MGVQVPPLAWFALCLLAIAACSRPPLEQSLGTPDQLSLYGPTRSYAIAGQGSRIVIAFAQRSGPLRTPTQLLLVRSSDSGQSWEQPTTVASEAPGSEVLDPVILLGESGDFVVAWREITGRAASLRLARGDLTLPSLTLSEPVQLAADLATRPTGSGTPAWLAAARAPLAGSRARPEVDLALWRLGARTAELLDPQQATNLRLLATGFEMWSGRVAGVPVGIIAGSAVDGQLKLVTLSKAADSIATSEASAFQRVDSLLEARPRGPEPPWIGATQGHLVVGWSEHDPGRGGFGPCAVRIAWSADRGRTWAPPRTLWSSRSALAPMARFAVAENHLVAVWRAADEGARKILFSRSTDQGESFSPPRSVAPSGGSAKQEADRLSPDIAVDALGTVGIAWLETRPASSKVWYWLQSRDSPDGGRATCADTPRAGYEPAFPRVYLGAKRTALVLWESRASRERVYRSPADVEKPLPATLRARALHVQ